MGDRVIVYVLGKDINIILLDGEDFGCRVIILFKVCVYLIEDDDIFICWNIVSCCDLKGDMFIWGI